MGNYVFMQTIKQLWYYTRFHLNNIYSMYGIYYQSWLYKLSSLHTLSNKGTDILDLLYNGKKLKLEAFNTTIMVV